MASEQVSTEAGDESAELQGGWSINYSLQSIPLDFRPMQSQEAQGSALGQGSGLDTFPYMSHDKGTFIVLDSPTTNFYLGSGVNSKIMEYSTLDYPNTM